MGDSQKKKGKKRNSITLHAVILTPDLAKVTMLILLMCFLEAKLD